MHGGSENVKAKLPWWPEARQRSAGREPLSRDQIVAAAIRIMDAEGTEAVSMRRLAQELGSGATSLYWHIKNKDELLDLAVDQMLGEEELADDPTLSWQERAANFARQAHDITKRHPHLAQLLGTRMTLGPNALDAMDKLVGILRAGGFEGVRLTLAYQVILNLAVGFAVMESRDITGPGSDGLSRAEIEAKAMEMYRSIPADLYPNLLSTFADIGEASEDAQFEYALATMLDGMTADLARHKLPAGGPAQV